MALTAPVAPKGAAQPASTPAPQGQPAPAAMIPFMRATASKSAYVTSLSGTPGTAQVGLGVVQIRPSGFLARLKLKITGTTSGNAATVAFQPDAPLNLLQGLFFQSPGGDTIYSQTDGFTQSMIQKYLGLGSGPDDPLRYPSYKATAGAGATGGSFSYEQTIPIEIDRRDAYGTIQNQTANAQFSLTVFLNTLANIYATAPTTPPVVTILVTMEFYSQPAGANDAGIPQQTAPSGNGTLNTIFTTTPTIQANASAKSQIITVGNSIRGIIFILRNSSGVRDEADWPQVTSIYVNTNLYFYKDKDLWNAQMAQEYEYFAGKSAAPAPNGLDNGVFVLTDWMNAGQPGSGQVNGSNDRERWLVTTENTLLEIESTTAWGAGASTLQATVNSVKPSDVQSLYAPQLY